MPDSVSVNEAIGVIEVRSYGPVSKEDIKLSMGEVVQLCSEKGIAKVLVDTTTQEQMPDSVGIFDLFSRVPPNLRVAIISDHAQPTIKDVHFAETVAQNRGLMFQVFSSREEALAWLGEENN